MVDAILGVIGTILYPLFSIIFVLIDLVQNIFRTFAGVGTIWYNEGGGTGVNANLKPIKSGEGDNLLADDNGGIVYYLLRSDLVMNLVWSIATLALILLIVFTVIAFIKNIYAPKSKSWQEIIGLSVKGLFNFIFIPVVCLLGVILGNILLNAIDGATSTGGATTISRKLFLSAAYDANVVRNQKSITYDKANEIIDMRNSYYENDIDKIKIPDNKKGSDTIEGADIEYYANLIDEAFASGEISIYEWLSVGPYYNMWGINYLTLAVGGVFILYALGSISFGMIKRLFTLIMLFIISPAACAMYPLDEGNACKQITGDFKKNTISAYGAVAGMNIFFSIAPLVQNINLASFTFFQDIIHIILLTCGLYMVKDFISKISSTFGAENAYESGAGMMSKVKKDVGGRVAKGVKGEFGTLTKAIGAAKQGGFWAGAKSYFGDNLLKKPLAGLNELHKNVTGVDIKADVWDNAATSYKQGKNATKSAADGEFKEKKTAKAMGISGMSNNAIKVAAETEMARMGSTEADVVAAVTAAGGTAADVTTATTAFRNRRTDKVLTKFENDEAKTAAIDLTKGRDFRGMGLDSLGLTLDTTVGKEGNIKNKNEEIENAITIVGQLDDYAQQLAATTDINTQKGIAKRLQNDLSKFDAKGNTEIQNLINEYGGLATDIIDNSHTVTAADTRKGNIDNMVAASTVLGKQVANVASDAKAVNKKVKANQKPDKK